MAGKVEEAEGVRRPVRGVVFDMDGTLTEHGAINFARMKERIGIARTADTLSSIAAMTTDKQVEALAIVEEEERAALAKVALQPGLVPMLQYLRDRDVPRAILTRNAPFAVDDFMERLVPLVAAERTAASQAAGGGDTADADTVAATPASDAVAAAALFDPMLTRDFKPTKPDPAPILAICKQWGIPPTECVMVGDFRDDMTCGSKAGATTVLLLNAENRVFSELADHTIDSLAELPALLEDRISQR